MSISRVVKYSIISAAIFLGSTLAGQALADYPSCSDVKDTVLEMLDEIRFDIIEENRSLVALGLLKEPTDDDVLNTITGFGLDNSHIANYTAGTFQLRFITLVHVEETGARICKATTFAEQRLTKKIRKWSDVRYDIRLDDEDNSYFVALFF